jgi:hypothetical protein
MPPPSEVGVLALGLLRPAPAGFARQPQDGRERVYHAPRAHLGRRDGVDLFHELYVPCAGKRDGLRKDRAAGGHVAVKRLAQRHQRNAQACLFEGVFLDGVVEFGHLGTCD